MSTEIRCNLCGKDIPWASGSGHRVVCPICGNSNDDEMTVYDPDDVKKNKSTRNQEWVDSEFFRETLTHGQHLYARRRARL